MRVYGGYPSGLDDKEVIVESKKIIDSTEDIKMEEETLSDSSHVYNIILPGTIECASKKDAEELFIFLVNGVKKKKWWQAD